MSLTQSYTKFRNLLDKHKMGYEFECKIWDKDLYILVSFGKIGTNYKETGYVCQVKKNDSDVTQFHERAYKYAIKLLEQDEQEKQSTDSTVIPT